MNRLPSEFFRIPPSPRTDSVTSSPFTDGGQTIPVGWNWTNSMLISYAPARRASAWPSPVYSQELRGDLEALADAAGGEDHRRRLEGDEAAGLAPVAEGAGDPRPPSFEAAR